MGRLGRRRGAADQVYQMGGGGGRLGVIWAINSINLQNRKYALLLLVKIFFLS